MNALILGVAIVHAALEVKEKPKEEPTIVGDWTSDTAIVDGGDPKKVPFSLTYVYTADGKHFVRARSGKEMAGTGRGYKVDTKASPMTIEMSLGDRKVQGIYKIEGDTLTTCFYLDKSKQECPTAFESTKGRGSC